MLALPGPIRRQWLRLGTPRRAQVPRLSLHRRCRRAAEACPPRAVRAGLRRSRQPAGSSQSPHLRGPGPHRNSRRCGGSPDGDGNPLRSPEWLLQSVRRQGALRTEVSVTPLTCYLRIGCLPHPRYVSRVFAANCSSDNSLTHFPLLTSMICSSHICDTCITNVLVTRALPPASLTWCRRTHGEGWAVAGGQR
jgi:hypothetical protein